MSDLELMNAREETKFWLQQAHDFEEKLTQAEKALAASQQRERAAEAAALEKAAKVYCVNCAEGLPLSDGKNGMHLGGLYCYAHAIRKLVTPSAASALESCVAQKVREAKIAQMNVDISYKDQCVAAAVFEEHKRACQACHHIDASGGYEFSSWRCPRRDELEAATSRAEASRKPRKQEL